MNNAHNPQHPAFKQPTGDLSIWRYLDSFKFFWMVNYGRLYMPRTTDLGEDSYEGTLPSANIAEWNGLIENSTSESDRQVLLHNFRMITSFAEKFRNNYFVSCWHMNPDENLDMWKSYTKSNESVAIKTTYSRLRSCLPDYVHIGCVSYIDYDSDCLPSSNMFECITHKRPQYAVENELRAVVLAPPNEVPWSADFYSNLFERINDPAQRVYAPVVDMSELIEEVFVRSDAPANLVNCVDSICAANSLPRPVVSRLIFESRTVNCPQEDIFLRLPEEFNDITVQKQKAPADN